MGTVLEIGTGWYPIVPVHMALAGWNVATVDITTHLTSERVVATFREFMCREAELSVDPGAVDRLQWIRRWCADDSGLPQDPKELLEPLGIVTFVGGLRTIPASCRFDLVCTNNTLEHVDEADMKSLLDGTYHLSAPEGISSHIVDLGDHFAHLDRHITPFNFLRYSKRTWRMIDNRIQPQNRLRVPDYRALFSRSGFRAVAEQRLEVDRTALARVKLHADYRRIDADELAVIGCHFVLERRGPSVIG